MAVLTNSGGTQLTTNAGKILVRDTGSILGFNAFTTNLKTTVTGDGDAQFGAFIPTQLSVDLTVRSNTSVVLLSCSTVVYTGWHQTAVFLDFGVSGGGFANNTRINTNVGINKDLGLAGGVGFMNLYDAGGAISNYSALGFNILDVHDHGQVAGTTLTYRLLMMAYDVDQNGGAITADVNYASVLADTNQIYPRITAMEISN